MPRKVTIESGIPIPPCLGKGAKAKYPWGEMNVGNSFFEPLNGRSPASVMSVLQNCKTHFVKRHKSKFKFTIRTVEGGLRVWRTK